MSVVFQALCAVVVCYLSMSMGIFFAWPSCTVKLFESANTTLHRPMQGPELALFGSLSSIAALVSTPLAGYFLDVVGRKYCAVFSSLSYVIAWSLIASSTQVEVILVAVFISGLGAAAMLIVRVYVSEICQESVRGTMTNGSMVFYSLGLLLSYALGDTLEYKAMVYACLAMSVVGVLLLGVLKESPTFLMKKGLEEEAAKSIAFYKRVKVESKEVLQEMEAMRRAFRPYIGEVTSSEEEKLQPTEINIPKKTSFWKFVKNSNSTRQAAILTATLVTLGTFQGLLVVQVYAKPLFEEAVPSMPPTVCSVVQAVITVFAGLASGYLSDRAGRRIKSIMCMLIVQWCWLCSFVILFIFNPLVSAIGLGPVFYLFAGVCLLSSVYSVFYLPETKGLPVDAIQLLLVKKET